SRARSPSSTRSTAAPRATSAPATCRVSPMADGRAGPAGENPRSGLDLGAKVESVDAGENDGVATIPSANPPAYEPVRAHPDQVVGPEGMPHPHAQRLARSLAAMGPEALMAAGRRRDASFIAQGITYESGADGEPARDRPFPLDLVPRIVPAEEWAVIERGLVQRITALNQFVDDI